ncbi:hypothetical protein [Pseudoduganella lurida]|uniref:hypothetical protein n=1 Tax=Pseudoduganella lurida TaxID=1036180 RepID=UPI0013159E68|nr:hypothetical protein [Pseudoduganella lurida]
MTRFEKIPSPDGLVRLSGTISDYRVTRQEASFFFTKNDQAGFGVIAVARR